MNPHNVLCVYQIQIRCLGQVQVINQNTSLIQGPIVTLFSHVARFHDHGICQLYFVGPSNKQRISVYYSYIQAELGNLGGIILPTLCTRMIVPTRIFVGTIVYLIITIHCSFLEITIHNNNTIENTDTIHNILMKQTGTIHYSNCHQFHHVF